MCYTSVAKSLMMTHENVLIKISHFEVKVVQNSRTVDTLIKIGIPTQKYEKKAKVLTVLSLLMISFQRL